MLYIKPQLIAKVRAATKPEHLHGLVDDAIRLSTPASRPICAPISRSSRARTMPSPRSSEASSIEEMLHMTIAANLLIAIGGAPAIDRAGFVPTYPGKLPMNVGNSVTVRLRKCSIAQIHDIFMQIEAPEKPLEFLVRGARPPATIGQFYAALLEALKRMGPSAFKGDFSREVIDTAGFGDLMFPITDFESAKKAIGIIVVQGEGPHHAGRCRGRARPLLPVPPGRRGTRAGEGPEGAGRLVLFGPEAGDRPGRRLGHGRRPQDLRLPAGKQGPSARRHVQRELFQPAPGLHRTFNGEPGHLQAAVGLMYDVRLAALDVLATPAPDGRGQCGLPFDYVPA